MFITRIAILSSIASLIHGAPAKPSQTLITHTLGATTVAELRKEREQEIAHLKDADIALFDAAYAQHLLQAIKNDEQASARDKKEAIITGVVSGGFSLAALTTAAIGTIIPATAAVKKIKAQQADNPHAEEIMARGDLSATVAGASIVSTIPLSIVAASTGSAAIAKGVMAHHAAERASQLSAFLHEVIAPSAAHSQKAPTETEEVALLDV
jgi:hypothetical protein